MALETNPKKQKKNKKQKTGSIINPIRASIIQPPINKLRPRGPRGSHAAHTHGKSPALGDSFAGDAAAAAGASPATRHPLLAALPIFNPDGISWNFFFFDFLFPLLLFIYFFP